jgi:hypothetical protein
MRRRTFLLASAAALVTPQDAWAEDRPQRGPTVPAQSTNWRILAADAGFGVPGNGAHQGDALMLRGGSAGAMTLYRMPWQDSDADRPERGGAEPILLQSVSANASDPLVPVRDGPFWSDPSRWLLWREGATVHALGTAGERQVLTLGAVPGALLRPALQRSGGEILVIALSADRRRLEPVQFARTTATAPRRLDAITLPLPVAAGTVGFATGGATLIGLSAATARGTTMLLLQPGESVTPRMVSLPGAVPVPDAAPALSSDADGGALLGQLVQTSEGIGLAEARFPADSTRAATIEPRLLGRLSAKAVGGAVLYGASTEGRSRPVRLLVRLADGALQRLGSDGALESTAFEGPPVPPLVLVPRGDGALVLCCDPRLGPFMGEA